MFNVLSSGLGILFFLTIIKTIFFFLFCSTNHHMLLLDYYYVFFLLLLLDNVYSHYSFLVITPMDLGSWNTGIGVEK